MEFTSASANKYLRRLQDEKDRLLRTEQEVSTYVLAEGEAAEPPRLRLRGRAREGRADRRAGAGHSSRLAPIQHEDGSARAGHHHR